MSSTEAVRVTIFNQSYSLVATEDRREIEDLAHMVDELMTKISRSGNLDSTRTAVLACLHLADQFRALQREHEALKSQVDAQAGRFKTLLDEMLGE